MVQLHAIMGGLDVRPATDADLLGALILKSAAYQADHAGYGDRHLYDAAMLASLITDPDAETRRLHSHTDRRRIKLPYDSSPMNHLTGTTLTNNIAEQDSMP